MMSDYFAPMSPDPMSGVMRLEGGDQRLFVRFEKRSRRNAYKSDLEGRPVYEPVDYVRIKQPAERDEWVGPVTEAHKHRFPRQWEQFQKETEQTPEGTPVELLFPNEPHVVELMLDLKIQTIEQLAGITEGGIERLGMQGRKYVNKARAALDKSEALKEVTKLTRELDDARDELATLKGANERLQARMQALEEMMEDKPRKRRLVVTAPQEEEAEALPPPGPPPPPPRPGIVR